MGRRGDNSGVGQIGGLRKIVATEKAHMEEKARGQEHVTLGDSLLWFLGVPLGPPEGRSRL